MNLNELVEKLKGTQVKSVSGLGKNSKVVTLELDDGNVIQFYHRPDCCETVSLVDKEIHGKIKGELLYIKASSNRDNKPNEWNSHTWTFYEVRTTEGLLTMRWLGESNGFYSESVEVWYGHPDTHIWKREEIEQ